MKKKDFFPVTAYDKFPEKYYFLSVIKNIIKIAKLKNTKKKILDFGCGNKILSKLLKNKKIINYDINPAFSDCKTYENKKFDIVVFNHVLMYLKKKEIVLLLNRLFKLNPKCEIILGLSKQNFISKIGSFLLDKKAHIKTKSSYKQQVTIFLKKVNLIKIKKNIFGMTDIYYGKFK